VSTRSGGGERGLTQVVLVVAIVAVRPDLGKVSGEQGVHFGGGS
jgi:hypothetical protein